MKTQTGAHNEATENFMYKKGYFCSTRYIFKGTSYQQQYISYFPAACGKYVDIKALLLICHYAIIKGLNFFSFPK